ncbi:MAG: ImmA/IrrE family metallo-endopeptidase [Lachnospiraceae bacterium]|nr:ImmA/IrrE family metallo-endopeptidase [Lachnospiraceae bacterium]
MTAEIYITTFIVVSISTIIISGFFSYKTMSNEIRQQIKLDVNIEQMKKSEQIIKEFFKENNLDSNVPIEIIAGILNITKGGIDYNLHEQAVLKEIGTTNAKIVLFKPGLSDIEERFIFAHEIAHVLNGDLIPVTRPEGYNKSQSEQLADYTAAALLMPLDKVYQFLTENNFKSAKKRKRISIIRKLCKIYRVSKIIALRRTKEIYTLKADNS